MGEPVYIGAASARAPERDRLLVVCWVLGLVWLAACSGEQPGPPPMAFDIDPGLLGERVEATALGIGFHPPAGWTPLSEADLDSLGRALRLTQEAVDLEPRYVFLQPENGSLLSVASLRIDPSVPFEEQMARYGAMLVAQAPGDSLRQGRFMKDDIHIAQFLAQPRGFVSFKLVFASMHADLIQFDYIVPKAYYPGEIKAIESSIGSIKRIQ